MPRYYQLLFLTVMMVLLMMMLMMMISYCFGYRLLLIVYLVFIQFLLLGLRPHNRELVNKTSRLVESSFIVRMLHKDIY